MSNVQVKAQLSIGELLKAVERLSQPELEEFVSQAITLRAKRRAPSLPRNEAELLLKINQGIPLEVHERYEELIEKQEADSLEPEEHDELIRLISQIEGTEVQRVEHLTKLADLRGTTLSDLMKQLGIGNPTDV